MDEPSRGESMLRIRDVMTSDVRSVGPEMRLPRLERAFIEARVSGFPVVSGGQLVGIVARSDVVRLLCVERSVAETVSDFYVDPGAFQEETAESFESIGRRLGARVESLTVQEAMVRDIVSVSPDDPVRQVAALLVKRHIHRVPVVDAGKLVGIVTSLDLVRLLAEDRVSIG
jgi:CBS domain-containing protein